MINIIKMIRIIKIIKIILKFLKMIKIIKNNYNHKDVNIKLSLFLQLLIIYNSFLFINFVYIFF